MKMGFSFFCILLVCLQGALFAQNGPGRAGGPRIGYVYPAGGKQGTTCTVTVGGQFLEGVTEAQFFGSGISAKITGYLHPTTQKEDEEYKVEAEKLREKRRLSRPGATGGSPDSPRPLWTPEDDKRAEELRNLLAYRMNRQTAPAICEAVVMEVTISPDAAPGDRELRLRNGSGLSNPLLFVVGQLPEYSEPAAYPNTMAPEGRNPDNPRPPPRNPDRTVTLPATVNGQILPGELDRIHFRATKGQKIVIAARARALIPYLADAVPGWFQATLALHEANGKELAYDDDFRFNPDPVLYYEIKADGEYVVEIKDSIYRGRQDFVYRISMGELPFITNIFPFGGPAGAKTSVEVRGWNLPNAKALMNASNRTPGELSLVVERDGILSNQVLFALDAEPEVSEVENNNDIAHAQKLTFPSIVNGRIDAPGDRDVFGFEGRTGQDVVVEVFARRLNSPLDSILQLLDPAGKQIAANDDYVDKGDGLNTHHADSRIAIKLPADGLYTIHLADAQHQGGPEFAYRLHVRAPHPDFELRVAPSSINVRGGAHVPVTIFALRKDGFSGAIDLALQDSSRAFGLSGARIPAGQDKIRLTLTTPTTPRDEAYSVNFVGRAKINDKAVVHEALPAEDMMQAFAYRHLVPVKEIKVQVIGRGPAPKSAIRLEDHTPVKIPLGGKATFRVAVLLGKMFEDVRVELSEPPEGISILKSDTGPGVMEVVFAADAAKAKLGQQGNLILMASGERVNAAEKREDKGKKKAAPRIPLSALPAISYEIVAP
ncbi:MAG: PPC domain-containing protein [Nibricoccus sp.]